MSIRPRSATLITLITLITLSTLITLTTLTTLITLTTLTTLITILIATLIATLIPLPVLPPPEGDEEEMVPQNETRYQPLTTPTNPKKLIISQEGVLERNERKRGMLGVTLATLNNPKKPWNLALGNKKKERTKERRC